MSKNACSIWRNAFNAQYPDSITEAGMVGKLTENPPEQFLERIKREILFSITKHNAKGILVGGHQECGGDQIDDATQLREIKSAVAVIKEMTDNTIDVVGVFVKRSASDPTRWEAEKVV